MAVCVRVATVVVAVGGCPSTKAPPSPAAAGKAATREDAKGPAAVAQPAVVKSDGYSPEMTSGAFRGDEHIGEAWGGHDISEDRHLPPLLEGIVYVESKVGDPAVVGCSDGQREGFADLERFPEVAGCLGRWGGGSSLVYPRRSDEPCGDDSARDCSAPVEVCALGWHLCGAVDPVALREGSEEVDHVNLRAYVTADECDAAGPGRFNAGLSHADYDEFDDIYLPRDEFVGHACMNYGRGAEPVCCGAHCEFGQFRDGVWDGRTKISRGLAEGCNMLTSARNGGVMCCKNRR